MKKIAVICDSFADYVNFIRRGGATVEVAAQLFHRVEDTNDVMGREFCMVIHTHRAEYRADFWELHKICLTRIRP